MGREQRRDIAQLSASDVGFEGHSQVSEWGPFLDLGFIGFRA